MSTSMDVAKAFGYLTDKEVVLLNRLASKTCEISGALGGIPTFVNIGAGAGTSSLALREGCPLAFLYSVDKSKGGPLGGFEGELNAFRDAAQEPPEQILGDSAEVGKLWEEVDIDLLFVDGDHIAEGVEADIRAWFPHVKIGGYIAFHDYNNSVWPDVTVVVDELMKKQISMSKIDMIAVFVKKTEDL